MKLIIMFVVGIIMVVIPLYFMLVQNIPFSDITIYLAIILAIGIALVGISSRIGISKFMRYLEK